MGSYAAFYLAGLYPLPATEQILLSSPFFREISFFNPVFNSTTVIRSNNFQGNPKNGQGGHIFVEVGQLFVFVSSKWILMAHVLSVLRSTANHTSPIAIWIGTFSKQVLLLNWLSVITSMFLVETGRMLSHPRFRPEGTIRAEPNSKMVFPVFFFFYWLNWHSLNSFLFISVVFVKLWCRVIKSNHPLLDSAWFALWVWEPITAFVPCSPGLQSGIRRRKYHGSRLAPNRMSKSSKKKGWGWTQN